MKIISATAILVYNPYALAAIPGADWRALLVNRMYDSPQNSSSSHTSLVIMRGFISMALPNQNRMPARINEIAKALGKTLCFTNAIPNKTRLTGKQRPGKNKVGA